MTRPNSHPSVQHEPHLRRGGWAADAREINAEQSLSRTAARPQEADIVDQSVWEEPALSPELSGGVPQDGLTFANWLDRKLAATTWARSWAATGLVAVGAGPWALLAAMLGGDPASAGGALAVSLVGPLLEETTKIAAALWVVERRPYLFRSRLQIALCVLAAALVFAAVENVMYLTLAVPNPPAQLVLWRWSVCVALHMSCSFVAGLGLMRIWVQTIRHRTKPAISLAAPFLVAAIVLHGVYNASMLLLQFANWGF